MIVLCCAVCVCVRTCVRVVVTGEGVYPEAMPCYSVQMQPQPQGLRSLNQPTLTKLLAAPPPDQAQPKPNQALANVKGELHNPCVHTYLVCVCVPNIQYFWELSVRQSTCVCL